MGKIRNNIKYLRKLPSKKTREAEVAELERRLNDPDDPYEAKDRSGKR